MKFRQACRQRHGVRGGLAQVTIRVGRRSRALHQSSVGGYVWLCAMRAWGGGNSAINDLWALLTPELDIDIAIGGGHDNLPYEGEAEAAVLMGKLEHGSSHCASR